MKDKTGKIEKREEVLVNAHRELVKKAAVKYLGKHYHSWVDDITQDVLLKILMNFEKFDGSKGKIEAWIYTITRNLCFDLMAKKDNLPKISFDSTFVLSADDTNVLEYKGLKKMIKRSIDQLSEQDRTMLILRYYFEFSGREIANHMSLPENQVPSRMLRAKERLRKIVENAKKTELIAK